MRNDTWSTYSEFYRKSGYSSFSQQHRESKGKFPFRMILVEQNAHNFTDPALEETIIALPLKTERNCRWSWSINDRNYTRISQPGRMLVVPSNTTSEWEVNARRTVLVLAVPNKTTKMILGGACPTTLENMFDPLTSDTWEEPLVEQMMNRLWLCANSGSLNNSYLADGLIMSIISQLLIIAGTQLDNPQIALPQWRMKRVKEYVFSRLADEISLNDLADAAGLSVRHFSRNFQKETGETPLRWVMKLRAEKSMDLLKNPALSLHDIAETCGFSSQSHFTTALKNLTGLTPYKWRQLHRQ
ncbi:helix-turn-helix domain-containing protein [Brenneria tiliae]|uniref:AraC family transcriptional regulator n=1 Tax=Brenneria tiliae TaxID=2914984 RepID=A0ABT0MYY2_9GAMM|nr:AraC family transcriptional regulator [Brenneria tiliae]MCL2895071.1 AraC family transcriptional regulator [Brenneria tiliae]